MVYSALAPIYDRVMSHVEYDAWVDLIAVVLDEHGPTRQSLSLLEIGGGTGVLGDRLMRLGYRYQGSDLAWGMCRVARQRGVPTVCMDGRALAIRGAFDMVVFLYDGINYLTSAAEYQALFSQVHQVLRAGGLFLFDITTETNSKRYFVDALDCDDLGDAAYMRRSRYEEASRIQRNDFVIFSREPGRDGLYRRFEEHHRQRVLPPTTIRDWIPPRLFEVLGVWDGFTMKPWGKSSERVHFLLQARGRQ